MLFILLSGSPTTVFLLNILKFCWFSFYLKEETRQRFLSTCSLPKCQAKVEPRAGTQSRSPKWLIVIEILGSSLVAASQEPGVTSRVMSQNQVLQLGIQSFQVAFNYCHLPTYAVLLVLISIFPLYCSFKGLLLCIGSLPEFSLYLSAQ